MLLGGIVLTGGFSRRMGRTKESLPWPGGTLLGRAVGTLRECCKPVVVVARDRGQDLPALESGASSGVELVFDELPGQGPLCGIATGLRALAERCDAALVASVDLPFLTADDIEALRDLLDAATDEGARGIVPVAGGRPHPLCAIYATAIVDEVERLVHDGERRARALLGLRGVRTLEVPDSARYLRNLNSPDDYREALAEVERCS